MAANRAFLTNNGAASTAGRGVTMGTKTVTINGTSYTTVPCESSSWAVPWSSSNGSSWGSALDFDFAAKDLVWASITGTNADTTAADSKNVAECTASAGKKCIGVATYDVSSDTLSRYFHPLFNETSAVSPDVLGYDLRAVAPNKAGSGGSPAGTIFSWPTSGAGNKESMASGHTSQMYWINGTFFVATAPDKTGCSSNSPELQLWDATLTTGVKQASIVMPGGTDKPEGLDVVKITSQNRGTCGSTADYAVYVTDYCNHNLYVYALDLNGTSSTFTLKATVDTDAGSSFGEACAPNSVRYYSGNSKVFVTCQTRETIQRYSGADLCDPGTSFEDEADLGFATASASATCGATPSLTGCNADSTKVCSPHTIVIDNNIATDWLFVSLVKLNQVVAVRRGVLDDQPPFFKQNGNSIEPIEFSIVSTP